MFKKSSKLNIRKRRDSIEDSIDINEEETSIIKPTSVNNSKSHAKSKKEKSKSSKDAKKSNLLSFNEAEEEESNVIKLKKSSRSKRIAKQIKKQSQEEKEALNNGNTQTDTKPTLQQPSSLNKDVHIFQSQKTKKDVSDISKPALDSQFADLNSGAIPTPSMIHAARKQREMLRKFGSEFISMEDTQKYKEKNQSRLIRDDDDDYSSDDAIMEMKGIEKNKLSNIKKYVPNESDEENDDSKEEDANADEEVNRWEEEIIKKGINMQTNQSTNASNPSVAMSFQSTNSFSGNNYDYVNSYYGYQNQSDSRQQNFSNAKSDVTFESLKKRLENHLSKLKAENHKHQTEMDSLVFDTSECEHLSKHLSDVKTLSEEYQFYQEIREYIKDLISCLRENVPVITTQEQSAHTLWKNQSDRLIARRRLDIRDEFSQITQSTNKNSQEKSVGSDADFVQRVRERQARRTRRRAARQIQKTSITHYDGTSTDDEETSMDQAQYMSDLQRIESSCAVVFEDVIEDFCSINSILQKFDDWRKKLSNSYNDAYIALCIPKLIIPFIRHKMVLWNPLLSNSVHFEEEVWFKELSLFGLKHISLDDSDNNSNEMDNTKVLSNVIEKVVITKLLYFIQNVWDPMSSQQTIRVSLLLNDLIRDYPCMTINTSLCQKIVQSICKRLQAALDNDIFIPLLPPSSSDDPAHIFLERQTWTSIKLFRNAMLLHEVLSYEILSEIAFDALLNRYILLALQTSVMNITCLYKCQRIIDSIPKAWFNKYADILSHLSSLSRFLIYFAKSVKASQQISSKTMLKQIKTMLLVIGARDALSEI